MYFTPLFYPVDILPNVIFKLMHINPMYHFVTYFRSLLYMGEFPSLEQNILCMGISLSFLLIGLAFFKERQSKFVLYI
jgi:ABC-2 type transport system permease protein